MNNHHANLRVRFYPSHEQWTCIVQRMDADGMPDGDDLVTGIGATKEEARDNAMSKTDDVEVREALKPQVH